jgi:hypothetical protein
VPNSVAGIDNLLDLRRVLVDLTGAVMGPWPEEPSETVPAASWHDVYVQMGDRLANHVVDRHERPLCSKRVNQGASDVLSARHQWLHQTLRQVQQSIDVLQRGHQYVSLEDRSVVKEGDHVVSAKHDRRVDIATADLAEHVISHRHETSVCRRRTSVRLHCDA